MCSDVFLDINFTSSHLLLFFHFIWHWLLSYFSYVLDGIWETNNYLTTFRFYLPFCTFGRWQFISGICMIVSPDSAMKFCDQNSILTIKLLTWDTNNFHELWKLENQTSAPQKIMWSKISMFSLLSARAAMWSMPVVLIKGKNHGDSQNQWESVQIEWTWWKVCHLVVDYWRGKTLLFLCDSWWFSWLSLILINSWVILSDSYDFEWFLAILVIPSDSYDSCWFSSNSVVDLGFGQGGPTLVSLILPT